MQRFWGDIAISAQSSFDRLRHRLERTTLRERVLLGALVLGAALYAPVHALESQNLQSEAYVDALSERSTARLAAQSARRVEASATNAALIEDMKTWGFKAQNSAVAQVLIEQRLVATADKVSLANPRITTRPTVESEGPTQWMFAEVQTDLRWGPTFNFLDAIGEWPEGFRVTGFRYEIQPSRSAPRGNEVAPAEQGTIRIGLAFPVRLVEQPDAGSSSGQPRTTGRHP